MLKGEKVLISTSITFLIAGILCFVTYAMFNPYFEEKNDNNNDDLSYVSYEILTDNTMPVGNMDTQSVIKEEPLVTRPYTKDKVKIGKSYYDYKGNEKEQEDSITYYENTYIQNTGVDYVCKDEFEILSIADGTVEKISKDDLTGTTIKIKHSNNLISIYQSVKDVQIKENDKVTKGQVLGISSTNKVNEDLGNHLHLEILENNNITNPEEYFRKVGV